MALAEKRVGEPELMSETIKMQIAKAIAGREKEVEEFFTEKYTTTRPLFYSSVDLRYSGNKIVPVDTNLFPAGFNLLSEGQRKRASEEMRKYFDQFHPGKTRVLIIPENHTRNKFYLLNLHRLYTIIKDAGMDVRIARLNQEHKTEEEVLTGETMEVYPLTREEKHVEAGGFIPELIVVNNDFSSGNPDILKGLKGQPLVPPVSMGWFRRRKSQHFETYDSIAREFARKFGFDNWLISAYFTRCGHINFKSKEGLDAVANSIDEILVKIKKKYDEYGIKEEPYVFVKANSGTYGMGIMVVKSSQEILEINKKERHSMNTIKEGVENSEVVIQEGIPTIDFQDGKPSEPMIYLVNARPVGATYRINNNQDKFGNLNSPGMEFLSFDSIESECKNDCDVQTLIARLASLAASRECYEENWEI